MMLCSQGVSYSGFLWDSSAGVDLKDATVLDPPVSNGNGPASSPLLYLAHFTVSAPSPSAPLVGGGRKWTRPLPVCVVGGACGAGRGQRAPAEPPVPQHPGHAQRSVATATPPPGGVVTLLVSAGERELVVLGGFGCPPQSPELDVLRRERFCPLVPPTQFTDISTRSPQGSRCLDNIWISRSLKKLFSGKTRGGGQMLGQMLVQCSHTLNQNFLCLFHTEEAEEGALPWRQADLLSSH